MALTETEELELLELEEEEARAKMAPPSASAEKSGIFAIPGDIAKRGQNMMANERREGRSVLGNLQLPLQQGGQAAGMVNDVVGRGVQSLVDAGKSIYGGIKSATPGWLKTTLKYTPPGQLLEADKYLFSKAANVVTPAIAKAGEKFGSFAQKHPTVAADVSGAANLGMLLPVGKGAEMLGGAVKGLKLGEKVGESLKADAVRNLAIAMRGGQRGANEGFNPENAMKYGLLEKARTPESAVQEVFDNGNELLDNLNIQAKQLGANSAEKLNVPGAIERVRAAIDPKKYPNDYQAMMNELDNIEAKYQGIYKDANIDMGDAMRLRTDIGKKSNFVAKQSGMGTAENADWKDIIYNKLYSETADEIKAKIGPELQKINAAQTELIPIVNVAKRRLPIINSNYRGGLLTAAAGAGGGAIGAFAAPGDWKEKLAGGLGGAVLGALGSRLRNSPGLARMAYKAGEKLSPAVQKPLKSLDATRYPNHIDWSVKPGAESDLGDPFLNLPKTKKEAAALNLGSSEEISPEMAEVMGSKRLTPEEYDALRMGESDVHGTIWDKTAKGGIGAKTVQSLKRSFGIPVSGKFEGGDFSKLDPKVQGKISSYVNDYNQALENDLPRWNKEYGAVGFSKEHLAPDDVIQIMNSGGQRGAAAIGPLAGSAVGGMGGASAGAQIGNTPEERQRNMLIGAGVGAVGGAALGRLIPASVIRGLSHSERGALTLPGGVAAHTGDDIADKLGVIYNGMWLGENDVPVFMTFTDPATKSTFVAKSLDEAYRKYRAMTDAFEAARRAKL